MSTTGGFRRVLGPWSAGTLVAGSMIGTGIFYFVSPVAELLPSRGLILAAWVAGASIAASGALCLAELAAAYPETGGIYVYLRRAFGIRIAFLYAWAKFLIMRTGSFAIPALAFAEFSLSLFDAANPADSALREAIAIAVVALVTGINIVGVRTGSTVQNVLTSLKVLSLLAIVAVGAAAALGLAAPPSLAAPAPTIEGSASWLLFATALLPVMWTFGGWDEAPFVAEEVRSPERNLPLAVLGGLLIVATLFIFVNAAYLAILTPAELAASGGRTATFAMERVIGPRAQTLLCLALMISTFGVANGLALTGARIAYAVGQDHAPFHWLGRLHPTTRTPVRALLVQAFLATTAIVFMHDPFSLLLYTGVAYWSFCALTGAAVLVLRRRDRERRRPFRTWGFPVTPFLFVVASIGLAISAAAAQPVNAAATIVVLLTGAFVHRLISGSRRGEAPPDRPMPAI